MTAKSPPKTLSIESRRIWLQINRNFQLEYEKMLLLKTALEQYDLYMQALGELKRDGISTETRQGIKAHPAAGVMKSARDGFFQAMKLLGISLEVRDVGRPTDDRELKWRDRLSVLKS